MICTSCRTDLPGGLRFCEECGVPTHPCPECAHANDPGFGFCEECGHALTVDVEPEPIAEEPEPEAVLVACASCGHDNPEVFAFCEECGHELASGVATPVPTVAAGPTAEVSKPEPAPVIDEPEPIAVGPGPESERAVEEPEPEAVLVACASCGHGNPEVFAFCEECGQALREVGASVPNVVSEPEHEVVTEESEPDPVVVESESVVEQAEPAPEPVWVVCGSCGHGNPQVFAFCEECGSELASDVAVPLPVDAAVAEPHPVVEESGGVTEEPEPGPALVACASCGHDNPEAFAFCEHCGSPIVRVASAARTGWARWAAAAVIVVVLGAGILFLLDRDDDRSGGGGSGQVGDPTAAAAIADEAVAVVFPDYAGTRGSVDRVSDTDFVVSYARDTGSAGYFQVLNAHLDLEDLTVEFEESNAYLPATEIVNLGYGEVYEHTQFVPDYLAMRELTQYMVTVPPGVYLQAEVANSHGYCAMQVNLWRDGDIVTYGESYDTDPPGVWSTPAIAPIFSGDAFVTIVADDAYCIILDHEYPVEVTLRLEVLDDPPPTTSSSSTTLPFDPDIRFWADPPTLTRGECAVLRHEIEPHAEVRLSGQWIRRGSGPFTTYVDERVGTVGTYEICPEATTTYTVDVAYYDPNDPDALNGVVEQETVTVVVEEPAGPVSVRFWADSSTIASGTCTFINWAEASGEDVGAHLTGPAVRVGGGTAADLVDEYMLDDRYEVCPDRTATYELRYRRLLSGDPWQTATLTIVVSDPTTMPPYLVLTHTGRLHDQLGRPTTSASATWAEVERLLDLKYGATDYFVLDFADFADTNGSNDLANFTAHRQRMRDAISSMGRPRYVIIIGGTRVVPFGIVPVPGRCSNPPQGGNVIGLPDADIDVWFSDDWYADLDGDGRFVPDVPLSRVPDGGDLDLIRAVFRSNGRGVPTAPQAVYAHGHPARQYVVEMTERLFGGSIPSSSALPILTDPTASVATWRVNAVWTYFILHGTKSDTSVWTGEPGCGWGCPQAFGVADASSEGLVVSEACYGAWLDSLESTVDNSVIEEGPRTASDSIALAFLDNGAFGFVGATASSYSNLGQWREPIGITVCGRDVLGSILRTDEECVEVTAKVGAPLERGSGYFSWLVFDGAMRGMHPLDAFFQAKRQFHAANGSRSMEWCGSDTKNAVIFVYYGLPPEI